MANYEASVKLSNFIDAREMELEDNDGNKEMCLVIPLEKNGLFKTKAGNIYCKMFVNEKTYDTGDNATHYFKLKTNPDHVAKMDSLGYETPFLGVMYLSKYKPSFQTNNRFRYNQRVKNIED